MAVHKTRAWLTLAHRHVLVSHRAATSVRRLLVTAAGSCAASAAPVNVARFEGPRIRRYGHECDSADSPFLG
jgi:hypothetical protein